MFLVLPANTLVTTMLLLCYVYSIEVHTCCFTNSIKVIVLAWRCYYTYYYMHVCHIDLTAYDKPLDPHTQCTTAAVFHRMEEISSLKLTASMKQGLVVLDNKIKVTIVVCIKKKYRSFTTLYVPCITQNLCPKTINRE